MEILHPTAEQDPLPHFLFRDVSGGSWHTHIGQQDIKVASVVCYINHGGVLRHIFLAFDDHLRSGVEQTGVESTLYKKEAGAVLPLGLELSDDPFHYEHGNVDDQE